MLVKKFGADFHSAGGALTLGAGEVCDNHGMETGDHERLHSDGWLIRGFIMEDYFYWVNRFEARHREHGRVWGDFEDTVYADSEAGFARFYEQHGPVAWDYAEI